MKYHPAKIMQVYKPGKNVLSSDNSTQALVNMWDENMFTFLVAPKIAGKLKKGDVVLVDYNPMKPNSPIPKTLIIKILKGAVGKETWKEHKAYHRKRRRERPTKVVKTVQTPIPKQSYG